MTLQHNSPRVIFIELVGVGTLLAHLINQTLNMQVITDEIAHQIIFGVFKYELDIRTLWTMTPATSMGVVDIEHIVLDIEMPAEIKQFIIFHCNDIFDRVEVAINEMMDMCIPKHTWDVISVKEESLYTLKLINEGDYRIYDWVNNQRNNRTKLSRIYSEEKLGM